MAILTSEMPLASPAGRALRRSRNTEPADPQREVGTQEESATVNKARGWSLIGPVFYAYRDLLDFEARRCEGIHHLDEGSHG